MITSVLAKVASVLLVLSGLIGAPFNTAQLPAAADSAVATIATATALQNAVATATPGSIIYVANGTYSDWNVSISPKGAITIKPQSTGGVTFSGTSRFNLPGSGVTLSGFIFRGDAANASIYITGDHNRVTANQFVNSGAAGYQGIITFGGNAASNQIDSNTFSGSVSPSVLFQITSDTSGNTPVPQNNTIQQNTFNNNASSNTSGIIVLGQGTAPSLSTNTLVSGNQFNNINSPQGIVVIRSSGNTVTQNIGSANVGGVVEKSGGSNTISGNTFVSTTPTTPTTVATTTKPTLPTPPTPVSTTTPVLPVATTTLPRTITTVWPLSATSTNRLVNYTVKNMAVQGTAGNDTFIYFGKGNTLIGGAGDDTYEVQPPTKIVEAPNGGIDTYIASLSTTLPDNVENLVTLDGTTKKLYLQGNAGNNYIKGGSEDDVINGWDGNDLLAGGGGSNVFEFVAGHLGNDVLADFNVATDHINFGTDGTQPTFYSYAQLKAAMQLVGSSTLITLPTGESVTIRGITPANLPSQDFGFPVNTSAGYKLTFTDDFNSFSRVEPGTNTGTWKTSLEGDNGDGGSLKIVNNGEDEAYVDTSVPGTCDKNLGLNPFNTANGVLTISANPTPASVSNCINNAPYTSGYIDSKDSFTQKYGYYEMRAELPVGKGTWPAFWLMPSNRSWPPETDIFEIIGDSVVHMSQILTVDSNGHNRTVSTEQVQSYNLDGQYHTYGVLWNPTTLSFYQDGIKYEEIPTPAIMNQPMYIIADLGIGAANGWPGAPDATTVWPQQMKIDYIRAYQIPGQATPVAPPALALTATAPNGASSLANNNSHVTVKAGSSVTLSWNAKNAAACTADQTPWYGNKPTIGSQTFTNISTTTNFTLLCWGPDPLRYAADGHSKNLNTQFDRKTITVYVTK